MTVKEQKQNHDEVLKIINQLSNPTVRDIDYISDVMKTKGFHPKQKIKLEKMLQELRDNLPEEKPQAMSFDKDSSVGKRREAEKVAKEAQDLADSKPGGSKIKVVDMATKETDKAVADSPSDRTQLFTQLQGELIELSDRYLKLARINKGGMASRLTMISRDLARHARTTLRL